uniref:MLA13uORF 3 n=1 Tax=Hordeum vulgare TaxID=4513 RepID=Q8GZC7_HORVU|nr:MLA13uORF 3 [Hordeum vulgare]
MKSFTSTRSCYRSADLLRL